MRNKLESPDTEKQNRYLNIKRYTAQYKLLVISECYMAEHKQQSAYIIQAEAARFIH
jgi:hypothetical protein